MLTSRDIGRRGENAAINYLENIGWKIICRNYRLGHKEIDLIGLCDNNLSLFEIKTRKKESRQIISQKQIKTLRQSHLEFCDRQGIKADKVGYALIIIYYSEKNEGKLYYYPEFL